MRAGVAVLVGLLVVLVVLVIALVAKTSGLGRAVGRTLEFAVRKEALTFERRRENVARNLRAARALHRDILHQQTQPQRQPQHIRQTARQAHGHYLAALRDAPVAPLGLRANIIDLAFVFAQHGLGDGMRIFAIETRDLAAETEQQRAALVRDRQVEARAQTDTTPANAYINMAVQNTDDSQNVHDPGVLACLAAIVGRLRAEQRGPLPTVGAILEDMGRNLPAVSDGRPERWPDVQAVARRTTEGNQVTKIGVTDEECLRLVWARAEDPRNSAARGDLRQAVFKALYDCWEELFEGERHIVCVNGRVSHILSSLVMLDCDERNWKITRLEQIKNEIFKETARVIEAEARLAAAGDDPDLARAARATLATTPAELSNLGEVPEAASEKLAEGMRRAISDMVDAYAEQLEKNGIRDPVITTLIANTKIEAQAAVIT